MKIKITSSVGWAGVDAGCVYEITGCHEGFLFFLDEWGREQSVHKRNWGRSFDLAEATGRELLELLEPQQVILLSRS